MSTITIKCEFEQNGKPARPMWIWTGPDVTETIAINMREYIQKAVQQCITDYATPAGF